jgi:hypothetical protein
MPQFMFSFALLAGLLISTSSQLQAQQEIETVLPHAHQAVEIESAPMINRIPLRTRQIRRIVQEPSGSLLIAEWETGSLIRLSPDGRAERLLVGLNQPSGLVSGGSGEIYLTLFAAGMSEAGELLRVDAMGETTRIVGDLNGPSDLVQSPQGTLVLCEYSTGRILEVDSEGQTSLLTDQIASPTALAYDTAGVLYIASRTEGALYRRLFDGSIERVQSGLQHPSDLFAHQSGLLLTLNSQTGSITAWDSQTGKAVSYARVPAETTCFCFDAEDNFVIGHWEYDFLMRITRHLSIPCPHCNERIPLHLIPPSTVSSPENEF